MEGFTAMPQPSITSPAPPATARDHDPQRSDARLAAVVEAAYILKAVGR